ncbi:MAG: hypothetical protein RBR68_10720 [Tenuifilaceae bacterium]|nr:hypothetical protein [Tenuifilaceae bacterium]
MNLQIRHKLILFMGFFLIGFLLQSCLAFRGITVVDDAVYSTRRIKAEFLYDIAQEHNSPLISLNQKIIKEVKSDSWYQYRVYDFIRLKRSSFGLEKKVFIIVDNVPFKVDIEFIESEIFSQIDEQRKDVLTADSTKISVVTGYTESQSRDYRFTYLIENEVIEKIEKSGNVMLRYYSGPDLITIKIRGINLSNLKKLIELQ